MAVSEQSEKLLWTAGYFAGASAQADHFSNCQELLVCLLIIESVKALCGKQIMLYFLNKAFLAKSMSQNPRNHHKEASFRIRERKL